MKPHSEVTLRRALPEDAPTVAVIWHLGWRDGHLGFVSQELIEARHEDSFRTRAAKRVNQARFVPRPRCTLRVLTHAATTIVSGARE